MKINDYIDQMVKASCKTKQHIRSLINLNRLISEFDLNLNVSDFSEQKTEEFIIFLQKKKYRPNTIKGYYQRLSYVLRRASQEFTINPGYLNCCVRGESPQAVYLSLQEIQALINLNKLTKSAETVRDYFIVMCFTGLRISDAKNLSRNNVNGDYIRLLTQKRKQEVIIPLHPHVRAIFDKWGNKFPRCFSQQYCHRLIRQLCRIARINEWVQIERTIGSKIFRRKYRKYELVSPHTARRSFITNLYLSSENKLPIKRLMLLSGHTTEQTFFNYLRIDKAENAEVMREHPFFTQK